MKNVVIKYGGHALDDAALSAAFCDDLAALTADFRFAVVHGGGPHISGLLQRLKLKSEFVNGLRVTDAPTLEVVEMALCGKVNKAVTRLLLQHGLNACGISGEDGRLFQAELNNPALGRVGDNLTVNPRLPLCLMENGFVPVVAPLALDGEGLPLNVNADTAAAALAASLKAIFVLVSDVPGVLDAEGQLLPRLDSRETERLRETGVISGGMIPKTEACLAALENGCPEALILNGGEAGSLKRFLLGNEFPGTKFVPN